MATNYANEDVQRVVDALDDADGWVKTMEAYEASAMLQALYLENAELKAKVAALEAARLAYALEFDLEEDEEGQVDLGNIHQNIRRLKAAREVAVEIAALYALELDRVKANLVTSEQNV